MLGRRRRRRANINQALGEYIVFAGIGIQMKQKELNKTFMMISNWK